MNQLADDNNSATDKSVALLVQQLADVQGDCLIVADENWSQANWASIANNQQCAISLVSNRFDIARSASKAGLSCQFNRPFFQSFLQKLQ